MSPDRGRCSIDLTVREERDVALHFDMRYKWVDQDTLVLNTMTNGVWGPEERPSGFNFTRGEDTNVTIVPHKTGFDIFTFNGTIASYNYRNSLTAAKVKNISWTYQNLDPVPAGRAEFIDYS